MEVEHGDDDGDAHTDEMEYVNMNSAYNRSPGNQPDRYDEDGVRLPDPVRQLRLLSGSSRRMMRGEDIEDVLARAEDPTIDWMFPVPRHLSNMGSLDEVERLVALYLNANMYNPAYKLPYISPKINPIVS